MQIYPSKKLYLPAVAIIVAVMVLLVIMGISTYRNLDREQQMAMDYLNRHGRMLMTALEAGARSAIALEGIHEDPIGVLLDEFARNPEVAYVYLCNPEGHLVHYARGTPPAGMHPWHPELSDPGEVITRVVVDSEGARRFELAKRYAPLFLEGVPLLNLSPRAPPVGLHTHSGDTIVVGLSMDWLMRARQSDRAHALFMGGIVALLGAGAVFFLFVVQRYYRVHRHLEASRDYIHLVVESMPNGLLGLDADGRIHTLNRAAADILGQPPEEIRGQPIDQLLNLTACNLRGALDRQERLTHCEIDYPRVGYPPATFGLSMAPLQSSNTSAAGAVLILSDLTELKSLADQVRQGEKLAAVGTLAAGVAHEIRNPLSSIRGFAHYLDHRLADRSEEREYARVMVREIDRINQVVSNLLSLARPPRLDKRTTDPQRLLKHVLTLMTVEARDRQVHLASRIAADLPAVDLDDSQLTQALLNLILNALQSMDEGGVIEVGAAMDGSGELMIWVMDDGPGIDAQIRERLFDPFFTTRSGGTGLGLAIVRQVVEQHAGRIELSSPPVARPRGCRFDIYLPVAERRPSS